MEWLIEKAMEFDQVDFNDLEVFKEYLLFIEQDNTFAVVTCYQVEKAGDYVYYTFFNGDVYRDNLIIYSGGLHITPDEGIRIYNWPPAIDGTGGQNTVNPAGGGTGNTRRRIKRKARKSRKRSYK
jgi:hypothetical protein